MSLLKKPKQKKIPSENIIVLDKVSKSYATGAPALNGVSLTIKQGEFVFRKGPVFSNILLADEINRATPRTQAGLLEAMEERQVTMDGVTYKLESPFFVIATENPLETLGTFPLPEAQLDRFLMKLSVGVPTKEEEIKMMERFMEKEPLEELSDVAKKEDILKLQKLCRSIYVHPLLNSAAMRISDMMRSIF